MSARIIIACMCALVLPVVSGTPASAQSHYRSAPPADLHVTYTRADISGAVMQTQIFSRGSLNDTEARLRRTPTFFATRSTTDANGVQSQSQALMDACPALYSVLVSVDRLVAPRFALPPLGEGPPAGARLQVGPIVPPDAPSFTVEGSARQSDGSAATLRISASHGPAAEFVIWAENEMAECWREIVR